MPRPALTHRRRLGLGAADRRRPRVRETRRTRRSASAARRRPTMPKFAANLTMLYNEHDFLDRFAAAATDGFDGVEYLFPYAYPEGAAGRARSSSNGLTQVLHNLPAGDWDGGERGIACLPDRVERVPATASASAIEYATALGCRQVNCLAGIAPAGRAEAEAAPDLRRQPALRRGGADEGRHPAADRADQHPRHPGLLPEPHRRRRSRSSTRSARTTSSCSTTSTTCRHGRRTRRRPSARLGPDRPHPDRRQSGPQRAGHRRDQLPLPVRAARPRSATTAGSAASTSRRRRPRPGSAGSRRTPDALNRRHNRRRDA